MSLIIPVCSMMLPASMKNGIAIREKESHAKNIFCAIVMALADGVITKNGMTDTPIAMAIGQPRIRKANKITSIKASIDYTPDSLLLKCFLYTSII